jgi:hypothetical protein
VEALETHLRWLREERGRLERQISAVETTVRSLKEVRELMAESMFEGFDHTQHREEVERRWGADAYAQGDSWWRGMSDEERTAWQRRTARLASDWGAAAEARVDPASDEAQALAERHVAWLAGVPGTPASAPGGDLKAYVLGLAEMYVADDRFAANYGGPDGAAFVRDALRIHVETRL